MEREKWQMARALDLQALAVLGLEEGQRGDPLEYLDGPCPEDPAEARAWRLRREADAVRWEAVLELRGKARAAARGDEDQEQNGLIGLLRAARRYDPDGCEWSSYAWGWIHASQRAEWRHRGREVVTDPGACEALRGHWPGLALVDLPLLAERAGLSGAEVRRLLDMGAGDTRDCRDAMSGAERKWRQRALKRLQVAACA